MFQKICRQLVNHRRRVVPFRSNIIYENERSFAKLVSDFWHTERFWKAPATQIPLKDNSESSDDSKNKSITERRSRLFTEEQNRQRDLIPRVEKIQVKYQGTPEDAELLLNKGLSTPLDVAQHLSETLVTQSALALVNGELWDMGRPLEEDCTVELMHFHMEDPFHVNRAFWRSCSFLLGAALENIFKDEVFVQLHSFPAPNVATGSFIYDVGLNMPEWIPTKEELMVISATMHRMAEKELSFERLVVDAKLAAEVFADNKYKTKQIPNIAEKSKSGNSVTLYRVGDHVDISGGPMVGDTSFLGRRCTIAAAHKVDYDGLPLFRFQGVALPKGIFLNHFAFGILEERASKLNLTNLSSSQRVNPV